MKDASGEEGSGEEWDVGKSRTVSRSAGAQEKQSAKALEEMAFLMVIRPLRLRWLGRNVTCLLLRTQSSAASFMDVF